MTAPTFLPTTAANLALHSIGPTVGVQGKPLSFGSFVDTVLTISAAHPTHSWMSVQGTMAKQYGYANPLPIQVMFSNFSKIGADISILAPVRAFHNSALVAIADANMNPSLPMAERFRRAAPLPDYAGIRAALIARAAEFPRAKAEITPLPQQSTAPASRPDEPIEPTLPAPADTPRSTLRYVPRSYLPPEDVPVTHRSEQSLAIRHWSPMHFASMALFSMNHPSASSDEMLSFIIEFAHAKIFAEHWRTTAASAPAGHLAPYFWLTSLLVLAHDITEHTQSQYPLQQQRIIIGQYMAALTGNATKALEVINSTTGHSIYTAELAKLQMIKHGLCNGAQQRLEVLKRMGQPDHATQVQHGSWAMSIHNMARMISKRE